MFKFLISSQKSYSYLFCKAVSDAVNVAEFLLLVIELERHGLLDAARGYVNFKIRISLEVEVCDFLAIVMQKMIIELCEVPFGCVEQSLLVGRVARVGSANLNERIGIRKECFSHILHRSHPSHAVLVFSA